MPTMSTSLSGRSAYLSKTTRTWPHHTRSGVACFRSRFPSLISLKWIYYPPGLIIVFVSSSTMGWLSVSFPLSPPRRSYFQPHWPCSYKEDGPGGPVILCTSLEKYLLAWSLSFDWTHSPNVVLATISQLSMSSTTVFPSPPSLNQVFIISPNLRLVSRAHSPQEPCAYCTLEATCPMTHPPTKHPLPLYLMSLCHTLSELCITWHIGYLCSYIYIIGIPVLYQFCHH